MFLMIKKYDLLQIILFRVCNNNPFSLKYKDLIPVLNKFKTIELGIHSIIMYNFNTLQDIFQLIINFLITCLPVINIALLNFIFI